MKVSDYIVDYLIQKGITDVFGYPGGMVTHLMDSLQKRNSEIAAHLTYHEQGAAFAACGYAQANGTVGVAYATSGPGATNLITGICNAYFDSIPTLFLTGQVNTFELRGQLSVRQRGFQETNIVSMVSDVTKYAVCVESPQTIRQHLDAAFHAALSGRKGPVLLDIPMNVFRGEIDPETLSDYQSEPSADSLSSEQIHLLARHLANAKRPVLLLGNGIKSAGAVQQAQSLVRQLGIPTVSTMPAVDILNNSNLNYGFIGAYGSRTANFVVAKCDLLITLGARLDVRQVGAKRENFAPNAAIIRVDIDPGELEYRVGEHEIQVRAGVTEAMDAIGTIVGHRPVSCPQWIQTCNTIRDALRGMDQQLPNRLMAKLSECIPEDAVITTDVGQNQVWVAQSFHTKPGQRIFFSGGHGAMGYSLPAAIGCSLPHRKPVFSLNGDGGIQMNLQELQTIVREKLPIKIIVFNNFALGMIRHFQEMYFDGCYCQTVPQGGYTVPDFGKIAGAYGLSYHRVESESDIREELFSGSAPCLIEIAIHENTYVFPKLEFGKPNQDQEPRMERALFERLMAL